MSIPSISMPMICASASYPRSAANMTFVLARAETRGPRIRLYCHTLPFVAERGAVEKPQRPAAHSGASGIGRTGRRSDTLLESRVEILIEEIDRLHNVHVAIDEPVAVFHLVLLFALVSRSAPTRGRQDCSDRELEFSLGPLGFARIGEAGLVRRSPLSTSSRYSLRQKKLAGTKVPAKFEQGGFTSGRREGPQTLFPGTSPGNLHRRGRRQKLAASKRMLKMEHFSADYHPEFLLARLQKLQRS